MTVDSDLIRFAERLGDAAGRAIRPYFRTPIGYDDKLDDSPVTIADREAERVMRLLVNEVYPEHGIIGEEWGTEREDAEYVWVFDPIDGTRAFISGMPLFCTLVALLHRGRPVLGLIDQPISRERWIGASGHATVLNGKPVDARSSSELAQAIMYTTAIENHYLPVDAERFFRLQNKVKLTRFSADAYAFGLLASGHIDIAIECGLKLYDFAALVPVVEGAGGVMTDWQGQPLTMASDGRVLACGSAKLHQTAIDILQA